MIDAGVPDTDDENLTRALTGMVEGVRPPAGDWDLAGLHRAGRRRARLRRAALAVPGALVLLAATAVAWQQPWRDAAVTVPSMPRPQQSAPADATEKTGRLMLDPAVQAAATAAFQRAFDAVDPAVATSADGAQGHWVGPGAAPYFTWMYGGRDDRTRPGTEIHVSVTFGPPQHAQSFRCAAATAEQAGCSEDTLPGGAVLVRTTDTMPAVADTPESGDGDRLVEPARGFVPRLSVIYPDHRVITATACACLVDSQAPTSSGSSWASSTSTQDKLRSLVLRPELERLENPMK
ncbi:hypothetical protein NUM3379_34740 [Kineococcus sp. NUM-3379]